MLLANWHKLPTKGTALVNALHTSKTKGDAPVSPTVGVIMGSSSDWPIMEHAVKVLQHFGIAYEAKVVSAHRMPLDMVEYASQAAGRGIQAIIAGAGGAAHLPGMVAALTPVPVYGVPVPSRHLQGQDSLLSIVQMPQGVPVATFSIGQAGAANAALHAVACLAVHNPELQQQLVQYRNQQTEKARAMDLPGHTHTGAPVNE